MFLGINVALSLMFTSRVIFLMTVSCIPSIGVELTYVVILVKHCSVLCFEIQNVAIYLIKSAPTEGRISYHLHTIFKELSRNNAALLVHATVKELDLLIRQTILLYENEVFKNVEARKR